MKYREYRIEEKHQDGYKFVVSCKDENDKVFTIVCSSKKAAVFWIARSNCGRIGIKERHK